MKQFRMKLLCIGLLLLSCSKEVPEFNAERSFNYLKKQVAFGPRNPGSKGHTDTYNFLVDELKSFGANVKVHSFKWTDKRFNKEYTLKNIVASFYPDLSDRVMLGAHWDTNPLAEKDADPLKQKQPILGANDGASGVAVLLEIGKILSVHKPSKGVDIILFDGEDLGDNENPDNYCIGSKEFVKKLPNYRPHSGIIVDLVGGKDLKLTRELNSNYAAKFLVDEIWSIASRIGEDSVFVDVVGQSINDDHIPFLQAGIPVIDLIDIELVAENKHQVHHTHNDIVEHCRPESLKSVGRVLLHYLY